MRTKALILGALPVPQEGPWVRIDEVERWVLDVEEVLEGAYLMVDEDRYSLDTVCEIVVSGDRARVVVESPLDVEQLTIILEEEVPQHADIQS